MTSRGVINFSSWKLYLAVVFIAASVLTCMFFSNQAFAAPSTSDDISNYDDKFDINRLPTTGHLLLSTNHNDSNGTGNFTPGIKFLVYKPSSSGNRNVTIDVNDLSCSDLEIAKATPVIDDTVNSTSQDSDQLGPSSFNFEDCTSTSTSLTIRVPAYAFAASERFGDSYSVSMVQIRLKDPGSGDLTRAAVISTSGETKLSYWGDRSAVSRTDASSDDFPALDSAPSITPDGDNNYVSIEFAPPCDLFGSSGGIDTTIYWRDADSGKEPNENQAVSYVVREDGAAMPGKAGDAGDGTDVGKETITMKKGSRYRITFYNVSTTNNNTIKVWVPFDQAGYYNLCDPPCTGVCDNVWEVKWTDNFVRQAGGGAIGTTVGDLAHPEYGDAPRPDQTYEYVNDAKNVGDRSISNLRWSKVCSRTDDSGQGKCFNTDGVSNDRWWSVQYKLVNPGYTNQANFTAYDDNTQNIAFDRGRTGYPDDTYSFRGAGVGAGNYVGGPGWVWDTFAIGDGDGGVTKCVNGSFHPSKGVGYKTSGIGTTSWAVDDTRIYAPQLCVAVPFYYNINQLEVNVSGVSGTTQQGTNVNVSGTIKEQGDEPGRNHTNTPAIDKGIMEFRVPSGTTAPTSNGGVADTLPCAWAQSIAPNRTDCNDNFSKNSTPMTVGQTLTPSGTNSTTAFMAIGTKLCYVAYAQHPKNTTPEDVTAGNSRYRYGPVDCTIIVKSPKVHFQNTDVTVGRHRSTVDNPCLDPINASIVTAGAPTIKDDQLTGIGNMYGSWVEYGAFATGSISGFGSAATPHGFVNNTIVQPQRLTFGNDGALGNFAAYGQTLNCLPNPFEDVNDDNTTDLESLPTADAQNSFETAGANKGNLYLNELAEKTTANDDKKGYIAKGSNIKLTPRSPTAYTADVSVEARPYLFGAACPQINITIFVAGVVTDSEPLDYCNDAGYETKTVNLNLGSVGYNGPSKVRIEYVNDAWVGGDRNIEVRNVNVKFNNNNTQQSHNVKDLPISNRVYDSSYATKRCEGPSVVTSGNGLLFRQSSASSSVGADGDCYGVEIYRNPDLSSITSMPPPPNLLNPSYTGFQSRDMVLYAKKADPTKKCTAVENAASGNILIDQDIIYSRTGFNSVLQLPRLVFVADCSITISDAVREVDASLVAGDAIKTCSAQRKTKDECNQNLVVRGGISANRLLLWRTFGADLQNDDGAGTPAENFDLSPSQMIANYKRGLGSATFSTTSESDLPPRY